MTVSTTTFSAGPYSIISGAPLPVPFRFIEANDLAVKRTIGGTTATLILGTDYTVFGNWATDGGGSVTLTAPVIGSQVTITRVTDLLQPQVYQQASRFPAASHERALDKLTMQAQEVRPVVDAAKALADANALLLTLQAGQINTLQSAAATASAALAVAQSTINIQSTLITALDASQLVQNNQLSALEARLSALDDSPQIIAINYVPSSGITSTTAVTFNANVVSALPIIEWGWVFYDVNASILSTSILATPARQGAYQASVRARNATGWSPYYGISIPVDATAPDIIDITFTPSSGLTTATPIVFAAVNAGGPISTYAWVYKTNGAFAGSGTLQSPIFTFSNPGEGSVELTATGPGGFDFYSEIIGTIGGSSATNRIVDHLGNRVVDHLGNFAAHA